MNRRHLLSPDGQSHQRPPAVRELQRFEGTQFDDGRAACRAHIDVEATHLRGRQLDVNGVPLS